MITINGVAGHHFHGPADLELVRHCTDSSGNPGYAHGRRRLVNRAAFNYDPTLGWETDRWFTWEIPLDKQDGDG